MRHTSKMRTDFVSAYMNRWLAGFLLILLTISPISNGLGKANSNHIIAGYGPVGGDLFAPTSSQIFDNKLFVLDQLGVSSYDLPTKQFIKRFPVDTGVIEYNKIWKDPKNWIEVFKSISGKDYYDEKNIYFFSSAFPSIFGNISINRKDFIYLKGDMRIDSKGNFYILGYNGISSYEHSTGNLIGAFPLPKDTLNHDSKFKTTYTFKIYNDQIYLVRFFQRIERSYDLTNIDIFVYSLAGNLEKIINLDVKEDMYIFFPTDFVFIPDNHFFGFLISGGVESSFPVCFFNDEGKLLEIQNKPGFLSTQDLTIDFQAPNKLYVSGTPSWGNNFCSIFVVTFKQNANNSISLTLNKELNLSGLGYSCHSISLNDDEISCITSGQMSSLLNEKAFYIQKNKAVEIAKSSFYDGQTNQSFAFAVGQNGNLFKTDFLDSNISEYDNNGTFVSKFKMNLSKISSHTGPIRPSILPPRILDMEADEQNLYCTNFLPNSISSYSFQSKKWTTIYKDDKLKDSWYYWLDMQIDQGKIYVLESNFISERESEYKSYLNVKYAVNETTLENIIFTSIPSINKYDPPIFLGFKVTDQEFHFLDTIHQEIWTFNKNSKAFIRKVSLPQDENAFYSSIDAFSDGSWLITDAVQNRMLHVSQNGELLDIIGAEGMVVLGKSQEEYSRSPDKFNGLFRAKIVNNTIYACDFFNFRYHIIPIDQTSNPKLEIKWDQEKFDIHRFSILEKKKVTLKYSINTDLNISYQVSAKEPWIRVDKETGNVSDKEIIFTIIGDKLKPFQQEQGNLHVEFPDYPHLNKDIPINIDSIGFIQWEQESVKLDKFSVFSEKIIDLPFTVTPAKEFSFTLTNSAPWIQLKADTGKSTDQKISLKILGDKLTPWQTNQGSIQVAFTDYPELNKTIPISVDAIGNIVTITIGSSKATLNDQDITLDSASIPLLKKGRTFVGIRFMGEIVFSNTAKISYGAKTQTVYFAIGSKKIELTINQPFALVNGTKVVLDVPPFIQNGRTFVPLRFISETLDSTVDFDAKTQSITITYPKKK